MKIKEIYAYEIYQQVQNGASVSDVLQLLQDFENQNWISVKEYLPEYNKPVFVVNEKEENSLGICRLESKTETQENTSLSFLEGKSSYDNWWYEVSHWRPIPNFEVCLIA